MKKRKNAGMSLIEVIVAVAIVCHYGGGSSSELCDLRTDKPQIEDLSGGDYSSPEYHGRDQGQNL